MKTNDPFQTERTVSEGMWMMTHPYILCLWLFAGLASAWKGWVAPSVFCGFVFIFFCASRIWGLTALRRVSCDCAASCAGLFPGQRLTMTRAVKNDKTLPLFWLEVLEPYDPDGCLRADARYVVRRDGPEEKPSFFCLYALVAVKWRQTVRFTDEWLAVRRGVRLVDSVELRSGDSFGLCPGRRRFPLERACMVAVYPALVSVDIVPILRDIWDSFSSSAGALPDTAWIKSIRDYLPNDPARNINQRVLARGQGLKVNQYEVVAPDEILFIMDTASYNDAFPDVLDESLSILASLICALQSRGIRVGLVVPATDYFPQTYVQPSNQTSDLAEMLKLLASVKSHDPPLTGLSAVNTPGRVYYLAYSLQAAASLEVCGRFPLYKCQILVYTQAQGGQPAGGWRVRTLTALRKL